MNCEVCKDLLPSYIDGLTSEKTNGEIKIHLAGCEKCKKDYRELTEDLKEECKVDFNEIDIIKRHKNRRKINRIVTSVIMILLLTMIVYTYTSLKIEPVNYGDTNVYLEIDEEKGNLVLELKGKGVLLFSGGEDGRIKIVGKQKGIKLFKDDGNPKVSWQFLLNKPIYLEFEDKVIGIVDGKIVDSIE